MSKTSQSHNPSRRDFLKKTAYVAPVVLTLSATPALAGTGSYCPPKGGKWPHHGGGKPRHSHR
jgi:hypothetical protein